MRRTRGVRLRMLAATMAIVALGLTACGGGDAATTAGTAEVDPAGVQWATERTNAALQRPTTIPLTAPIGAPVPAGKRIAYIDCGAASCTSYIPVIRDAVSSFGWTLESVSTDGTPGSVKNAWASILRQNFDGIMYSATERSVIDNELREAASRGIPVAALNVIDPPTDGITFVAGDAAAAQSFGEAAAAYTIAESGGTARAVSFNIPGYPIIGPITKAFTESTAQHCPGCEVEVVDIPVASLGKDAADRITSYLRSHPDVEFVFLTAGALAPGLPAALRSVGITGKRLLTPSSDPVVMDMITKGELEATVSFDSFGYFYAMTDALARSFAGVPQLGPVEIQNWVIRKDTVVSTTERFPFVADMREQYARLWATT
ncbi:sugar ABC transporter substrate-binding protein [Pseudonocardia halophobica]|uniref:sugar ABC transporter substrate-binding protein n=1 Tax=Pseudonocardia halophobica TaxID=29401 RepID=UPI003D905BB1